MACVAVLLLGGPLAAGAQTPIGRGKHVKFAILITSPGSYVFERDLVPPQNATAIEVEADNVSIDLNGFTISGSATARANAWAVYSSNANGLLCATVRFAGSASGSARARLFRTVTAQGCAVSSGIAVGSNSVVLRSQVLGGSDRGIVCAACTTTANCSAASDCLFADDVTAGNHVNGMECFGDGCEFSRDVSNANGAHGLAADGAGSLFIGNVADNNSGAGIATANGNGARENVLNGNAETPLIGVTSMGDNLCNGSAC